MSSGQLAGEEVEQPPGSEPAATKKYWAQALEAPVAQAATAGLTLTMPPLQLMLYAKEACGAAGAWLALE